MKLKLWLANMGKRRECKAVNFQAAARSILLCLWSTQSQMQGSKLILQYWWRVYAICNMHNTDNASSTKIINPASLWSVPLSPAFGKSKSPCNSPITICWFASQFKETTLDWRHKKQPSWYKKGPTAQKISFFILSTLDLICCIHLQGPLCNWKTSMEEKVFYMKLQVAHWESRMIIIYPSLLLKGIFFFLLFRLSWC